MGCTKEREFPLFTSGGRRTVPRSPRIVETRGIFNVIGNCIDYYFFYSLISTGQRDHDVHEVKFLLLLLLPRSTFSWS